METRGERNCNPGNIRLSDIKFQGEIDGDDKAFKTFENSFYGIRAIAKILLVYYHNHGLNTIQGIISRWAPGNENDTEAYVQNVSARCNRPADEEIDCTDEHILDQLVVSIIFHENGRVSYTPSDITKAVDSALEK